MKLLFILYKPLGNINDSQQPTKHEHRENLSVRASRASELGNFRIYTFQNYFFLCLSWYKFTNFVCMFCRLLCYIIMYILYSFPTNDMAL